MKLPDGYTPGMGVVKSSGFGGFGERMLKTFGWEEGKGLGKEEQGMSSAIEIRKKDDQIGVGFGPDRNWNAWWENAYEEAAKGVRVASGAGASRPGGACSNDSSSSDQNSDSDDSSDDEYAGKGRTSINRDGTVATGSVDELRLLASLAKAGGRVAAGRFGGRDAKMERIRRQEALEAQRMREKLGLVEAVPTVVVGGSGVGGAATNGKGVAGAKGEKKREKVAKAVRREKKGKCGNEGVEEGEKEREEREDTKARLAKRQRIVIECGDRDAEREGGSAATMPALKPTPASGWWGCNLFRSAGALDSSPLKRKGKDKTAGFSEDQQAKIYETAQLGKTSGKTGLGKGRRGTIKIEGAVWKGTKVTFDDEAGGVDEAGAENDDENEAVKEKKRMKRKHREKQEEKRDGKAAASVEIKWKKVVKRAFKNVKKKKNKGGAPHAKIKSLHKEVVTHLVTEYGGGVVDDAEVRIEVEKCITAKSSSFSVSACGKFVSRNVQTSS